jgi:hypothetical protein
MLSHRVPSADDNDKKIHQLLHRRKFWEICYQGIASRAPGSEAVRSEAVRVASGGVAGGR